ncbi:hypothetical protein FRC17_001390 [Serendipita sp. 399]|nr:hypothetical protein FRC17_001390 [Serendipita sp. 399]
MASASSSHSTHTLGALEDSSTCDESADDIVVVHRDDYKPPTMTPANPTQESSPAATFTRSISPIASRKIPPQNENLVGNVTAANSNGHATHTSPSTLRHSHSSSYRHRMHSNLLPKYFSAFSSIPRLSAQVDTRKFIEHLILFTGAITTLYKFSSLQNVVEYWLLLLFTLDSLHPLAELGALVLVTAIYMVSTRMRHNAPQVPPHIEQGHRRHASPVLQKDSSPNYSLLWMTSSKDYRSDADDGVLSALLLGPIITASMLYGTITVDAARDTYYPPGWIIESPLYLQKSLDKIPPRQALLNSRRNLVQLSTLCAFVLLTHLCTSNLPAFKAREAAAEHHGSGWERRMRKGRRSWLFVGYATIVSITAVAFHILCDSVNLQFWKDLSYFDVAFISSFYQFSVYVMIRLSHGGFTLGEVCLIGVGSTVLVMEAVNMTIAKVLHPMQQPCSAETDSKLDLAYHNAVH